jgi:hypothetical protein
MDTHGDQRVAKNHAGIAARARAIGGERRVLAHLATQGGLRPQDQPAREQSRRDHVAMIKTRESSVRAMEAVLPSRDIEMQSPFPPPVRRA